VHRWGDVLGLAGLVCPCEVAIECLEHETSESKGVQGRQWVLLDYIPAPTSNFRRRIAARVGYQPAVCL
jgi:hypothetical protein